MCYYYYYALLLLLCVIIITMYYSMCYYYYYYVLLLFTMCYYHYYVNTMNAVMYNKAKLNGSTIITRRLFIHTYPSCTAGELKQCSMNEIVQASTRQQAVFEPRPNVITNTLNKGKGTRLYRAVSSLGLVKALYI